MATNNDGIDRSQWNGVELPYIPPEDFEASDHVAVHDDYDEDVDPITYEVIRHALWNTNREAGQTIENLAVSNIVLDARDFQTGILTEDAEFLYFGQYIQYFSGTMDASTKWLIENRSDEPGIEEDDMFIHNDHCIGAPHQPDVSLIAPVFYEGEIFY
jgi:N-methylhydantoinase B